MVTETQGNESATESTESTGTETSSATSTDNVESDASSKSEGMEAAEGSTDPTKPAKPAYTPNFKFKVIDKEQEFDDWLKPHIKDADTEKKVRDLYERAHGIEYVKQDRQRLKEQSTWQQNEIARHSQVVNNVNHMIATKDYDNLFANVLKIPEDDILRQAHKILQLRDLPPEQRQAYEQGVQARQQALELQNQNQHLMQSHEQVAVHARTQELEWTMQRPQIATLVSAYDARAGKEGAFRQAVIERGQYNAYMGKDISPEQAIQEVLNFLGGPESLIPAQAAQPINPQGQQAQASKPVITNIQGRGTSPAKKVIKSLDDLKKRANELAQQEA